MALNRPPDNKVLKNPLLCGADQNSFLEEFAHSRLLVAPPAPVTTTKDSGNVSGPPTVLRSPEAKEIPPPPKANQREVVQQGSATEQTFTEIPLTPSTKGPSIPLVTSSVAPSPLLVGPPPTVGPPLTGFNRSASYSRYIPSNFIQTSNSNPAPHIFQGAPSAPSSVSLFNPTQAEPSVSVPDGPPPAHGPPSILSGTSPSPQALPFSGPGTPDLDQRHSAPVAPVGSPSLQLQPTPAPAINPQQAVAPPAGPPRQPPQQAPAQVTQLLSEAQSQPPAALSLQNSSTNFHPPSTNSIYSAPAQNSNFLIPTFPNPTAPPQNAEADPSAPIPTTLPPAQCLAPSFSLPHQTNNQSDLPPVSVCNDTALSSGLTPQPLIASSSPFSSKNSSPPLGSQTPALVSAERGSPFKPQPSPVNQQFNPTPISTPPSVTPQPPKSSSPSLTAPPPVGPPPRGNPSAYPSALRSLNRSALGQHTSLAARYSSSSKPVSEAPLQVYNPLVVPGDNKSGIEQLTPVDSFITQTNAPPKTSENKTFLSSAASFFNLGGTNSNTEPRSGSYSSPPIVPGSQAGNLNAISQPFSSGFDPNVERQPSAQYPGAVPQYQHPSAVNYFNPYPPPTQVPTNTPVVADNQPGFSAQQQYQGPPAQSPSRPSSVGSVSSIQSTGSCPPVSSPFPSALPKGPPPPSSYFTPISHPPASSESPSPANSVASQQSSTAAFSAPVSQQDPPTAAIQNPEPLPSSDLPGNSLDQTSLAPTVQQQQTFSSASSFFSAPPSSQGTSVNTFIPFQTSQPSLDQPSPGYTSVNQPPLSQPPFSQPPVGQPLDQPPISQLPISQPPFRQPAPGQPLDQQPISQLPFSQPPVGQSLDQPPVSQPPVSQPPPGQPLGQPPISQPPFSQHLVSQPPLSQSPLSQPPLDQPPINQPPFSQPPVNQPLPTQPATSQPSHQHINSPPVQPPPPSVYNPLQFTTSSKEPPRTSEVPASDNKLLKDSSNNTLCAQSLNPVGPPPPSTSNLGNSYRRVSLNRPTYAPVPDLEVTRNSQPASEPVGMGTLKHDPSEASLNLESDGAQSNSSLTHEGSLSSEFSMQGAQNTEHYKPAAHHWFYKKGTKRICWQPFSMADSLFLEQAFASSDLNENTKVPTDGGRYDVLILQRKKVAVYWDEEPMEVRRCSWFVQSLTESRFVPYDENIAEYLEEEYRQGCLKNEWNRRIELADGEVIVLSSRSSMAQHSRTTTADEWNSSPTTPQNLKPRIVKRSFEDFGSSEEEPTQIDHLVLVVHGIGKACDWRFRSLIEVVEDFRSMSLQLIQSHFKQAAESGEVGRVEVLPVEWHQALHSEAIDKRLADITLPSIPKAREFTNGTILDVLFYSSPMFSEKIVQAVGAELNKTYNLFMKRNPDFKGGVSLGGHSLGSLILFDMLSHQEEIKKPLKFQPQSSIEENEVVDNIGAIKGQLSRRMSYLSIGTQGAGQPIIDYPHLDFYPTAFFAFGSPIGMFLTIRGIESLGEDFKFPTCSRFFNIFHPYDPVAYRIEALVSNEMAHVPPILIPHHKGRKRMHLELKDTMAHITTALKQKLVQSVRSTLSSVFQLATFHRGNKTLQREVDQALEEEVLQAPDLELAPPSPTLSPPCAATEEQGINMKVGSLNQGNRIDYVLQESPLETFNHYISALRGHLVYWESEDTMLMVLREIYASMGVKPDSQVPQQILPFDINSEDHYSEYTDSIGAPHSAFIRK